MNDGEVVGSQLSQSVATRRRCLILAKNPPDQIDRPGQPVGGALLQDKTLTVSTAGEKIALLGIMPIVIKSLLFS